MSEPNSILDDDLGPLHDGEALVVERMTNMSQEERDQVLHDLHGISGEIEETEELIQDSLDRFNQEVTRLMETATAATTDKGYALRLASLLDETYTNDAAFRLRFLRCDEFNAVKAAERFASHFKTKLELFGEERLTKDITQDDLDEETMQYLYSGLAQNLPLRDKSGRHVSLYLTQLNTYSESKDISVRRRIFYSGMVNSESIETQKKGFVIIFWTVGSTQGARLNPSSFLKIGETQRSLPGKIVGWHFCYDNSFFKPVISLFQMGCDLFAGLRMRSHYGNHLECKCALQTFGIPTNLIPVSTDGTVTSKDFHVMQMEKRRKYERQEYKVTTVMIPGSFDILVGKGKPLQEHVGNILLRSWIDERQEEYLSALKLEKKAFVLNVIDTVRSRGGRFLKDDGGYWVEVEEEVARAKVGHLFRDRKRKQKKMIGSSSLTSINQYEDG